MYEFRGWCIQTNFATMGYKEKMKMIDKSYWLTKNFAIIIYVLLMTDNDTITPCFVFELNSALHAIIVLNIEIGLNRIEFTTN